MPNVSNGRRFYLNDFDNEDMDALILDVANEVWSDEDEPLEFYINSEGGDANRALALVELINLAKHRSHTVETFVLSQAHSAGSLVAVAGSQGHRYVARDGYYMVHYGVVEFCATNPAALAETVLQNQKHFSNIHSHYTRNCKIPKLHDKLMVDGFYVDSTQALLWGMADKLIEDY